MSTHQSIQQALIAHTSPRERQWLKAALGGLVIVLVWNVLIAPAWHQIANAPAERQLLDHSLQHMQLQAQEARQLRTDTIPLDSNAEKIIQTASKTYLGAASLATVSGDRATITLVAVGHTELAQWLRVVRQNARAKPLEAHLTQSGTVWGGRMVLAVPTKSRAP